MVASFQVGPEAARRDLERFVGEIQAADLGHHVVGEAHSRPAAERRGDLVDAQVVRYRSFDGEVIPANYYKPKNIRPGDSIPAIIHVHGGPGGQARKTYSDAIQYFVNHGYAVLSVNNRGSSGYGKRFRALDDMRHGQDDLRDCIEGKNWLVMTGYVDPDRVAILGASYGGYMVLAALTFAPEE